MHQTGARTVLCQAPAARLAESSSHTLSIPLAVPASAPLGADLPGGQAAITYPGGDTDAGDDVSTFYTKVSDTGTAVPVVTINQPNPAPPGGITPLKVTVTNHGPSDAQTPTTLTITLPAQTTLAPGFTLPGCTANAARTELTCALTLPFPAPGCTRGTNTVTCTIPDRLADRHGQNLHADPEGKLLRPSGHRSHRPHRPVQTRRRLLAYQIVHLGSSIESKCSAPKPQARPPRETRGPSHLVARTAADALGKVTAEDFIQEPGPGYGSSSSDVTAPTGSLIFPRLPLRPTAHPSARRMTLDK